MLSECWFCNECIMYESLACLAENSIVHISFPDIEYFRNRIVFEELNVRDDIEHRRFVHPIRKRNHFGACITVSKCYSQKNHNKVKFYMKP